MDPFDEFEFKPLTEGLGFHKKKLDLKEEVRASGLIEETLKTEFPLGSSLLPEPVSPNSSLTSPLKMSRHHDFNNLDLPFPGEKPKEAPTPTFPGENKVNKTQHKTLESLNLGKKITEDFAETAKAMGDDYISLKAIPFDFGSAILDAVIVLSLSLLFTVAVLLITGVDIRQMMVTGVNDYATQIGFAVLYLSLWQIYSIIARSFFGATLGEWAFDIQLGNQEDQKRVYYPLLVVWRSLVCLFTGVVTIPMISMLAKKDICRYITGTQLYRRM